MTHIELLCRINDAVINADLPDLLQIAQFIRSHGLKARKVNDSKDADQREPWRIKRSDVRKWLIESAEWDHRRCRREWLIEILAGRVGTSSNT